MSGAEHREIRCKSVLNRVTGMPFRWSVNPYRGCTHGCHYCYARATHTYLELNGDDDFSRVILVKVNAPEVLRREVSRPSWRRESVAIGTATDAYQPLEGRYRLTRAILAVLLESGTPVSIVTKSPLIVRDLDLLAALARGPGCTVAFSLTTLDRQTIKRIEPGTATPQSRLWALQRLAAAGIRAGVLIAPVLPGITDRHENLEEIVRAATEHGASFVGESLLYLKPVVKEHFFTFLATAYPHLIPRYRALYPGSYGPTRQAAALAREIDALRRRYGLPVRNGRRREGMGRPEQLRLL